MLNKDNSALSVVHTSWPFLFSNSFVFFFLYGAHLFFALILVWCEDMFWSKVAKGKNRNKGNWFPTIFIIFKVFYKWVDDTYKLGIWFLKSEIKFPFKFFMFFNLWLILDQDIKHLISLTTESFSVQAIKAICKDDILIYKK